VLVFVTRTDGVTNTNAVIIEGKIYIYIYIYIYMNDTGVLPLSDSKQYLVDDD